MTRLTLIHSSCCLSRFVLAGSMMGGLILSHLSFPETGLAQVVPDSTLGAESSIVAPGAGVGEFIIEGGAQRNTTLFHSFDQFSINSTQSVLFDNPALVENIFSRVTGGIPSNIDGLLGVDGPANLFFLNPSGIIFGPNAELDMAGSFVATTANQFIFPNGSIFSAVNPEAPPLLTLTVPVGVQLGANPQPIQGVQTNLESDIGQTLALIGGDVRLNDSNLSAPEGKVGLAGLSSPGTITLNLDANTPQGFLTLPDAGRADVVLNNSVVDNVADMGGDIVIQAQNISLTESELTTGVFIDGGFDGSRPGTILLDATGDIQISQESEISNVIEDGAVGEGGGIIVEAENLSLLDSGLFTLTNSDGSAGDVEINVNNRISVSGVGRVEALDLDLDTDLEEFSIAPTAISIASEAFLGEGNAGTISLHARQIVLDDEALVGTTIDSLGQGGGITITTDSLELQQESFLQQLYLGPNRADDITISTESLVVRQGSNIIAITDDIGRSGDIRVQATNIILDDGGGSTNRAPRGINTAAQSDAFASGTGGDVIIETENLTLIGALIGATVFGDEVTGGDVSILASDTVRLIGSENAALDAFAGVAEISTAIRGGGVGNSGDVSITAPRLILENGSIIDASAEGEGDSGSVFINTSDSVILRGQLNGQPSRILTQLQNFEGESGGDIDIRTGQLTVQDGAQISAATQGNGDGGNVSIFASRGVTVTGATPIVALPPADADSPFVVDQTNTLFPSGIFASSPGRGDAGSVEITTPDLVVRDRAQISVSSTTDGFAGSLDISANTVLLDNGALIAETVDGNQGNISLLVRDRVELFNRSSISTSASGAASGGNITIANPTFLFLRDQSSILTQNSGGSGNGGNINISADFIVAFPGGQNQIVANAFEGNGGNINLTTNAIFGSQFLNISASSNFGVDGNITVDTPGNDPANSLSQLPTNLLDTTTQIADACDVNRSGQSQFVVTGRGGLPLMPSSQPTGHYLLADLGTIPASANALSEVQPFQVASNAGVVAQASSLPHFLQNGHQAYQQARYSTAILHWTQAVTRLAEGNDPVAYASTLSNLALAYHHLGDWKKAGLAIATSQKTLTPDLIAQQPALFAQVLNARASLHFARGDARAAIQDWQQAAEAYQDAKQSWGVIQVQLNQAQALQALGFVRQAQMQLEKIAPILETQPNAPIQALTLLNLGNVFRAQGDMQRSQQTLQASLAIAQSLNQPKLTSTILLNLGHTAQTLGKREQALGYYQQAKAIAHTPLVQFQAQVSQFGLAQNAASSQRGWGDLQAQAQQLPLSRDGLYAQLYLMDTVLAQNLVTSPQVSLDMLARILTQAKSLNDPIAHSYALGYQGRVYRQTQQQAEAVSLTEQALRLAQEQQAPEAVYQFAWQLGRYRKSLGNRSGAIAAYNDAIEALRALRGDLAAASAEVQFSFRDGVEPVYRELVKLLLQGDTNQPGFQTNLIQARKLIEDLQLTEIQDYFRDACVQSDPVAADQVDPKAAVIYPIVLDDRVDVIVSIGKQPLRHYSTPIQTGQVEKTVKQLLRSLSTPLGSLQKSNLSKLKQVHDWVVGPAIDDLEQAKVETLVFVADGALRTLPLTTLYDGKQYLIEQYNVALSPGLNLLAPRPQGREGLRMLVGGLSEARSGFPALPFVTQEVETITTQVSDNEVLFNQDLTEQNLTTRLSSVPSEIIHLATHAEFGSSPEDTFILTWEGKLSIQEMAALIQTRNRSSEVPVDLLVLSACKTAAGDSRAVLGIAGMAIRSGVRSTLAGLWSLNDQAAAAFMSHFYEALDQPNVTKAEAFRQAQLALMKDPKFRAPYFWSPFVLVGNWL